MFVVTLIFAGLQLAGAVAVFAIARMHREAGLLGAFSYEFLRDTPPPKKAEPDDDDLATLGAERFLLR